MALTKYHEKVINEALDIIDEHEVEKPDMRPEHIDAVFSQLYAEQELYNEAIEGLVSDLHAILDYVKEKDLTEIRLQAKYGLKTTRQIMKKLQKMQGEPSLVGDLGL